MQRRIALGILAVIMAISCRKTHEIITIPDLPDPPPAKNESFIQVNVTGIQPTQDSLFALLTLKRKSGETIYENGKLALHQNNGVYSTDSIKVINEEYLINKLIVVRASDTAVYAIPRPQTEKSGLSNTPLEQIIKVPLATTMKLNYQAVKINMQDNPQSFGYTTEDFGYLPFVDLVVDLSIKVGKTVYDSLPAKLSIDAVNSEGGHWIREMELPAGSLHIAVPQQYNIYEFSVHKWNVFFRRSLMRDQLNNGKRVHIEFSRPAKQLIREEEWREVQGVLSLQESSIEYSYFADKSLSEIKSYQRLVSGAGLSLSSTRKFKYQNQLLDSIIYLNAGNVQEGYTWFTHTGNTLTNILQKNGSGEIGAAIEYKNTGIDIYHLFSNGITSVFRSTYKNGNKISDNAVNSRGTGESATYIYDHNINPYEQMNFPDIYLTRLSKNNKIGETRQYTGDIPMTVPSKYEYEYDYDGYPTVLWITMKGYSSNQELYRVKRVFTYR